MIAKKKIQQNIVKYTLILVWFACGGYLLSSCTESVAKDIDFYLEPAAKCNYWEVRDKDSGILLSHVTPGMKDLIDLTMSSRAPLIRIEGQIIGTSIGKNLNWGKPYTIVYTPGAEAKKEFGSQAKYGLIEINYSADVATEHKSCITEEAGDKFIGLPLTLYNGRTNFTITPEQAHLYTGLEMLKGDKAVEKFGSWAEERHIFNYYKTDVVSEIKNNNNKLSIDNKENGKILVEYTAERIGEIDVVINQEFEQFITHRYDKTAEMIQIELDPAELPSYNFFISVFKAGTEIGIDSQPFKIVNGKIALDFSYKEGGNQADVATANKVEDFVYLPAGKQKIPTQLYKSINNVVEDVRFKIGDAAHMRNWYNRLTAEYGQKIYVDYIKKRFAEEASSIGFDLNFSDNIGEGFSLYTDDISMENIIIEDWNNATDLPQILENFMADNNDTDTPLLILDKNILKPNKMKDKLDQTPIQIKKMIVLERDEAVKRFGKEAAHGAIILFDITQKSLAES